MGSSSDDAVRRIGQSNTTRSKARTRRAWSLPFVALIVAVAYWATPASASVELRGLSAEELRLLDSGGAVERRFELPHRGEKYLGAVSYGVLGRPCEQAKGLWSSPIKHLAKALPATRQVEFAGKDAGERPLMRLKIEHGNAIVQGTWGAIYRLSEDGMSAQFWLDPNAPKDVRDVFGFFRLSPWSSHQCLVTAAVAVDPGDGMLASMFRATIHNYLVRTAARIQRYVKSGEFSG
jgi:hypothetical protein